MESTPSSRLFDLLDRKGKALKPLSIGIGLSPTNLGKKKREGREMYASEIVDIIDLVPEISAAEEYWVFTGKKLLVPNDKVGMFDQFRSAVRKGVADKKTKAYASSSTTKAENITAKASGTDAIPLSDSDIKRRLGRNHLVKPYEVQGDSMAPTLRQGDTVYCTDEDYRAGYIHVIEYEGGTVIKRLERHTDGYYVAISDNAAYPKFRITDDEIVKIWLVKCKLSYDLSGPGGDLNSRLTKIEQLLKR